VTRNDTLPHGYAWYEPTNYLGINWEPPVPEYKCFNRDCKEGIAGGQRYFLDEKPEDCPYCGGKIGGIGHPRNHMPTPFTEIDHKEFLKLMVCGDLGLAGTNFRQVHLPGEGGIKSVHFFLFPAHCIAAADIFEYNWSRNRSDQGLKVSRWKESYYRLRFFRIGCSHGNMKEVSHEFAQKELGIRTWGMHCHVSYCPDCGYHRAVDSSG